MGRIAVVTGANQGLGLAVVMGMAATWTGDDVVYLTGRDPARVEAAASGLVGASARVVPELLDVTLDDAASGLAARLRPAMAVWTS
ncbi:MAG TPA: hypothetical protein VFA49_07695 [Chloroflexota bacterium]|jgi:NAD(P)-dependent dehydrogenase (short-subunit alcohol dehydrogenase family)|nr:hypothetical protein [Chloroflexota bacterium]